MYKLSPFVWEQSMGYSILLRVVNVSADPSRKVARIHAGRSENGRRFILDQTPVIGPSENIDDPDSGGCEDPTLAYAGGRYYVYYTGWNERDQRGSLLLASGSAVSRLDKHGVALASTAALRNPKEATIARGADGRWRLFFEFADGGRSRIGMAESEQVDGPWRTLPVPFESRAGAWDAWHLSTGPIVEHADGPLMFYNGSTQDAAWRIGWIQFDPDYRRVIARCDEPLVTPGERRTAEDTDIAFAASAIAEGDEVSLYYSIADRYCMRAGLRPSAT